MCIKNVQPCFYLTDRWGSFINIGTNTYKVSIFREKTKKNWIDKDKESLTTEGWLLGKSRALVADQTLQ